MSKYAKLVALARQHGASGLQHTGEWPIARRNAVNLITALADAVEQLQVELERRPNTAEACARHNEESDQLRARIAELEAHLTR